MELKNIFKSGAKVFGSSKKKKADKRRSIKQNKSNNDSKEFVREMMNELGVRGLPTISSYNDEEINPDDLSIDDYIKMQNNDGTVRAVTRLFSMPIQSTETKIIPHKDDDGEAEFIRTVLKGPKREGGMSTPLSFIIADMTRAIFEGFRVYEKVPQIIEQGEYEGLIGWKKLAPRESRTVRIISDEEGGFDGIIQRAPGMKGSKVEIPPEKCLLYTFQKEKHPFYGESILKTAYYHYDKKHKLYYLAHKKAEIDAVGIKMLRARQNSSQPDVREAEEAVDSLVANSRITLPDGIDLEIDRAQSGYDVLPLIEHHDKKIMVSTLTQAVNLGQQSTYGYTYGSGYDSHTKFINQMMNSVMDSMTATINQWAVAPLIDWNFGTGAYPEVKMMPLEQETEEMLVDIFKEILRRDMNNIDPEFTQEVVNEISEKLGIEIKSKSVEDARQSFENGKREIFDRLGEPAVATDDQTKKKIELTAEELKGSPDFLEKFEAMGKSYAKRHLTKND